VMSLGLMFEKRKYAFWVELVRLVIFSAATGWFFAAGGAVIAGVLVSATLLLASLAALKLISTKPRPVHAV